MSFYFPQAAIIFRIVFENFDGSQTTTQTLENNPFQLRTIHALAKNVSVQVNPYTQADTFHAEVDYKQFPFDPRTIRSCGITIHMQDMGKLVNSDGSAAQIKPSESNVIFQGFADEDSMEFNEDTRTIRLEGRDFTGLFADTKYDGKTIPTDVPLDQIYAQLIAQLPGVAKIAVTNLTGLPLPTLAQFAPDYVLNDRKQNSRPNSSYWDVVQDLANRAALIVYIAQDKLIITTPRVLYGQSNNTLMIYGQNLKGLSFKRKLGRKKNFNIAITSFDFKNKTPVLAQIPKDGNADWLKALGIAGEENVIPVINADGSKGDPKTAPYTTFRFPNMNKAQCIVKGQAVYEEMGRQQLEGSLTTNEMLLPQQNGSTLSAFNIDVGTPIKIGIDADDLQEITKLGSLSKRRAALIARGYNSDVASAFAAALGKFSMRFYTKAVEYTINQDNGFSMKVDLINFIEITDKGAA
jgi:hypothetical protein